MARPRTPSNVLEMRGAYKKDPQRRRKDEPEAVAGIGHAPSYFEPDQVSAWDEIVGRCHAGVLCDADGLAVEQAALLLSMSRKPIVVLPNGEMSKPMRSSDRVMLIGLLARFGMTPSDRSKVAGAKKEEPANPFAKLIKKKGAA